jgi:chloride channel 3/4/5
MAGGELVLLLVSECDPDRPSHLCVSKPSEIRSAIWAIAVAMVLKGLLTVITFGIKLPAGETHPAPFHRALGALR